MRLSKSEIAGNGKKSKIAEIIILLLLLFFLMSSIKNYDAEKVNDFVNQTKTFSTECENIPKNIPITLLAVSSEAETVAADYDDRGHAQLTLSKKEEYSYFIRSNSQCYFWNTKDDNAQWDFERLLGIGIKKLCLSDGQPMDTEALEVDSGRDDYHIYLAQDAQGEIYLFFIDYVENSFPEEAVLRYHGKEVNIGSIDFSRYGTIVIEDAENMTWKEKSPDDNGVILMKDGRDHSLFDVDVAFNGKAAEPVSLINGNSKIPVFIFETATDTANTITVYRDGHTWLPRFDEIAVDRCLVIDS